MNFDSFEYWENRHKSKPVLVENYEEKIKKRADFLNKFIKKHKIKKIFDYGCGIGIHSQQIIVENYLGIEISEIAVQKCRELNPDKEFYLIQKNDKNLRKLLKKFKPDLSLSLWVISHLTEDELFKEHMEDIFYAKKFVIIQEIDIDEYKADYQKQRNFTEYIKKNFPEWKLKENKEITYIYVRKRIL